MLGGEEVTRGSRRMERLGDNTIDQFAQILQDESRVILFYANIVFFFVGEVTVSMYYSLTNFQVVVLVLCTHSNGMQAREGTNMKMASWYKMQDHL